MTDLKKLAEELHLNDEQKKIIEEYGKGQVYYLQSKIRKETDEYDYQREINEETLKRKGTELLYQFIKTKDFNCSNYTHYFNHYKAKKASSKNDIDDDFVIIVNNQQVVLRNMFLSPEKSPEGVIYVGVYTEDYFYFAVPICSLDATSIKKILKLVDEYIRELRNNEYNVKGLKDGGMCCDECCTDTSF